MCSWPRKMFTRPHSLLPMNCTNFLRMPFGMVKSGATLMRALKILLKGMENVERFVDDILILNFTSEEQMGTFQELLRRMTAANLTTRPTKTVIGANLIELCGQQSRLRCYQSARREPAKDSRYPKT